jgi:hypothetical protein
MIAVAKGQEHIPAQDSSRVIEVLGDVGHDLIQQWGSLDRSDKEKVGNFCETLDEAVFNVAKDVYPEQIARNIARVRSSDQKEQRIAASEQQQLLTSVKMQVVSGLGLEGYSDDDIDLVECRKKIQSIISGCGEDSLPEDTLKALGLLEADSDTGKMTFVFPEDIMTRVAVQKWQTYIDAVNHHIAMNNQMGQGTVTQNDIINADRDRRTAHNGVSQEVMKVFSMVEGFTKWDFEETRNMIAKMRERRLPNKATGEAARTAEVIRFFHDSSFARKLGHVGTSVLQDVFDPDDKRY